MVDFSVLKRADQYSEPVRLRTSWQGSSKNTMFYGTWTGLVFSFLSFSVVMTYLLYIHGGMEEALHDTYNTDNMLNKFDEGHNEF